MNPLQSEGTLVLAASDWLHILALVESHGFEAPEHLLAAMLAKAPPHLSQLVQCGAWIVMKEFGAEAAEAIAEALFIVVEEPLAVTAPHGGNYTLEDRNWLAWPGRRQLVRRVADLADQGPFTMCYDSLGNTFYLRSVPEMLLEAI